MSLIIVLFCTIGCNDASNLKGISEGSIVYGVEYNDSERSNPTVSVLPSTVTTYFKENSSCTKISGGLGFFKLAFILNDKVKSNYTLMQVIDMKYVYKTSQDKTAFGYKKMPDLRIEHTNKEKKIAGFECQHAMAIYNNGKDTIELFYTEDIGISHPNLNNPFKEIDGVLMEFSATVAGIKMRFKAKTVKSESVDESIFRVPKGYTFVSAQKMEALIQQYDFSSSK